MLMEVDGAWNGGGGDAWNGGGMRGVVTLGMVPGMGVVVMLGMGVE